MNTNNAQQMDFLAMGFKLLNRLKVSEVRKWFENCPLGTTQAAHSKFLEQCGFYISVRATRFCNTGEKIISHPINALYHLIRSLPFVR
jgi:hypothetical protein